MSGAAPLCTDSTDSLPVPRHGSYSRSGVEGPYRLHYCDWGRADNPRVVMCVHGAQGNARDFDVLARDLSANFRVICPDLSGRGECDWLGTATGHTFPQLLADLDGLLSGLMVEEVDWIGTSLGGILGMHLAVAPGTRIRRLVMMNAGESFPFETSPHSGRPLSAPMAGVHSVDLWKILTCPTVLLRGDVRQMLPGEIAVIRRFLSAEASAPRRESYACAEA
jgi:Alpha/beta hydrolase family